MCGRFAQHGQLDLFMQEIDPGRQANSALQDVQPTWNLAPSQEAWTIVEQHKQFSPMRMNWGFKPAWAKQEHKASINARVETAASKPYFRDAWRKGRCIVPADCFYEWQVQPDGSKQPMCIMLASGRPMLFGGLYATSGKEAPDAFAVVSTEAKGKLAEVHSRMPLILAPDDARSWLDPSAAPEQFDYAAAVRPSEDLVWHAVSKRVNDPKSNDAGLMQDVAA